MAILILGAEGTEINPEGCPTPVRHGVNMGLNGHRSGFLGKRSGLDLDSAPHYGAQTKQEDKSQFKLTEGTLC